VKYPGQRLIGEKKENRAAIGGWSPVTRSVAVLK